ncbi:MAG: TatD family nuclease-associated radical SAM protein [Oscillospiraceae bacterium]|nr:TatD family nuclease-associated radical SAM protein [Oscillospiraceae bacterium]
MASIVYSYGENLYLNLTTACPCACDFCIRQNGAGLGSAASLWLEHAPGFAEVQEALTGWNLRDFAQIVFCGFGEPTCALEVLLEVCAHLRRQPDAPPIRLNTNGLADLIHSKPTAPLLAGLVDSVSISLNAPTAEEYDALCHPSFGLEAFPAIVRYARAVRQYVPHVCFTVVDVLGEDKIALCREIAEQVGVPLRVRVAEMR